MAKTESEGSGTNLCFACGAQNPIGLKLKPVHHEGKVTADFTPGKYHQGWNNTIHGGILYTLLDEITAYALLCSGIAQCVTAKSSARFKHMAQVGETIHITGWVTKLTKRLAETRGALKLEDDSTIAEIESLFYIVNPSKRAIIWDMDGVIADTALFHFKAWEEILARRKISLSWDLFISMFGMRNDTFVRKLLGEKIAEKEIPAIVQEKESLFKEKARHHVKPFPGVINLLEAVKKGNFKQALASSAPRENIDFILQELKIEDLFHCTVSGHEVSKGKPDPQIFLLAAEKMGVVPSDCDVIEDSPYGIRAARAAGMSCLAVSNTHNAKDLKQADKIVASLEKMDLIALFYNMMP